MEEKILQKAESLRDQMIEGILELVQIDSIETEPEPGAPFGPGVKTALGRALELSEKLGFHCVNLDNYIGYAEYGQGRDYVCAMGHVDVVPVGDGWRQPPFSGYMENNVIYSRGILDNKGPVLSCLYGLYGLKELGYKPKHRIRIIFGCDEESGFEDLTYYLNKEKPPLWGFTPDRKFPVVYAERGRAVIRVKGQALEPFFDFVTQYFIGANNTGDRLGINVSHKEYGVMEMRGYKLGVEEKIPYFEAALSYPAGYDIREILGRIRNKAGDLTVELRHNYNPVIFDKDSPLVRALTECYETVTGESAITPMSG